MGSLFSGGLWCGTCLSFLAKRMSERTTHVFQGDITHPRRQRAFCRTERRLLRRCVTVALAALATFGISASEAQPSDEKTSDGGTVIRLWAGDAPLAKGNSPADVPTITMRKPAEGTHNGTALIVCPGGGYGALMTTYEGKDVADWFRAKGVTTFELQYRIAPYQHPAPLMDAQQAIRTIRARAKEFEIHPERIGIVGFSAGGHLAATAATLFDTPLQPVPEVNPDDAAAKAVAQTSARPDFAILAYPVINLQDGVAHVGSRKNLLGATPDPALVKMLSADLAVTEKTPPTFLFHTGEDVVVPASHSLRYYQACLDARVPAEMHVFEHGRHGVGLAQGDPVLRAWPELCAAWMRRHGWLGAAPEK